MRMKKKSNKELKKEILEKIVALHKLKGSRPTKTEFVSAGLSDHLIRKFFGGWNVAFEEAVDLGETLKTSETIVANKYRSLARSIQRKNILEDYEMAYLTEEFAKSIKNLKLSPVVLNKKEIKGFLKKIQAPTVEKRELVAPFSDWHLGLKVDSNEVGNSNSFGWTEGCRRCAFFAQEIANYKLAHRAATKKLHLASLGDINHGKIHNKTGIDTDLIVHQMNGALHVLFHMISYLLNFFDEIVFYGIPGNHEDWPFRREGGNRVNQQKYDSVINPVYYALSLIFAGRVKFVIPKTQYVMIDTIGGRLIGVHGDTVFSAISAPGKSINFKALTHQIESFNTGEIKKGNPPIAGVLAGHVHQELKAKTQNGIDVVVNSTLSGKDPFASSLSINYAISSQTIVESTKKHPCGDIRRVQFSKEVDNNKELDKIIPIYDLELEHKK